MNSMEILPPSGGRNSGSGGGNLQNRPAKVLRPIHIIDVDDSEDHTHWTHKVLENVMDFIRQYRKSAVWILALTVLGYIAWKILLGVLSFFKGAYAEVTGVSDGIGKGAGWWLGYGLLTLFALLALRFMYLAFKGSSLSATGTGSKNEDTFRTVMHGVYSMWTPMRNAMVFCATCISIFIGLTLIVQNMELFKRRPGPVLDLDPAKVTAPGERSAYFDGQTHFLNEVIQFCYFDKELGLTREQAWDCVDTIKAESEFRMYNEDGSVYRGEQNPDDTGVLMINVKHQAENIAKARCNIDSFECQKKVFRLAYLEKRSFEPWKGYTAMKTWNLQTFQVTAPTDELGGEFYLPKNGSCYIDPDREMLMVGADGTEAVVSHEFVPFMESPAVRFRSKDGVQGRVTIKCRTRPS